MGRTKGLLALVAALGLVAAAAGGEAAPAPDPAPAPAPRLERGETLRELGAAGDPIRVAVHRYRGEGTAGRLFVATVDPRRVRLGVQPAARPVPLATLAAPHAAGDYVAVNGGFYDREDRAMGLVVSGGTAHAQLRRGGGSGVFYVRGGKAGIAHRDDPLLQQPLDEALQSIDRLVHEGQVLVRQRPGLPRHDARSAVAIDARGQVLIVVAVDERSVVGEEDGHLQLGPETTTTGPTLWQLAELLARPVAEGGLGARQALNLDGGFSTALQVQVAGERLSLAGYRGTINALVARPR